MLKNHEKQQESSPLQISSEERSFVIPSDVNTPGSELIEKIDVKRLLPTQNELNINLEQRQELTRSQLAVLLIKILAGTLVGSFTLVITMAIMSGFVDEKRMESFDKTSALVKDLTSALVKDLITFILTAQTGLIGTALGFYFGSRGSQKD